MPRLYFSISISNDSISSLEFGLMLCFTYVPYALAEVPHLHLYTALNLNIISWMVFVNQWFLGITLKWNYGHSILWDSHVPLHTLQSLPSNTGTHSSWSGFPVFDPLVQITMQQTMRTMSFVCESCVFIYLGLGIFSFPHKVKWSEGKNNLFVGWTFTCCLVPCACAGRQSFEYLPIGYSLQQVQVIRLFIQFLQLPQTPPNNNSYQILKISYSSVN